MIRWCRFSASILLFSFLSLLLVFRFAYAVLPLVAAGLALLCVLYWTVDRGFRWRLDQEDGVFLLTLLAFAAVWLGDVWRTDVWPVGEGNQGAGLPLWPVLAALLLVAWRQASPRPGFWWWGLAFGALLAGAIAAYEHWWLGRWRVGNGVNAIPFGNLSLLLGTLSLAGLMSSSSIRNELRLVLALAAVGGLLASVLSGTRGGWVVFPVLVLILLLTLHETGFRWGRLRVGPVWLVGVLVAVLLTMSLMPGAPVKGRLAQGVTNLQEYADGDAASSLGIRLEMWRAGWQLIKRRPGLGWGEGRLEAQRDVWVEQGRFHPGISRYDQLHSDLVDTFARRGLVGLLSLMALYGVPLWLFWCHWRKGRDEDSRALALCGVLVG
ncbi:O-antigen ligase family protein [uncultured Spongiibacter sp.]|uniref:O-antigen ligase family protein n=1 Tax=uncultured Spongiibacter sp. TaxID=870896 RepID=UPI00259339CE|nr:O-antigen ligase family protein [uncultured Spongiibacter sp.]